MTWVIRIAGVAVIAVLSDFYWHRLRRKATEYRWQKLKLKREQALADAIDRWHKGDTGVPLHEYLHLSPEEYARWLRDPDSMEVDVDGTDKR